MRIRWLWLGALLLSASCEDCGADLRNGPQPRCGKCEHSDVCSAGLRCLNGVCETAPPSCHVDIGL